MVTVWRKNTLLTGSALSLGPGSGMLIICEVNPGHRVSAEFAVLKLEFGVLNNADWLNMLMSYVHNMSQSGR